MKLFDPDPRLRWLFCLTHPDDEIAIGAWIHRLAQVGAEVHLSWTHDDPIRQHEAHQSAKVLGIPRDRLHFHHGPDRVLCDALADVFPSFQRMMNGVQPDRVVAGAFEQGHLDHDSTNYLVHRTFGGVVLETPLYHAYCQAIPVMNRFATQEGEEALLLEPKELDLKLALARCHPSQAIFGNLVWYRFWETLRGTRERVGSVERLRRQTHFDYRTPNLLPGLAKRVIRTNRWKRWIQALDRFEAVHTSA